MKANINRRSAIKGILASTAALSIPLELSAFNLPKNNEFSLQQLKGNINHSVSRWCFDKIDLETLCIEAKKMGITGIDLVGPEAWPTLKKYNLVSTMCNGAELNLVDGFNDIQFHEKLIPAAEKHNITLVMELLNSKIDHKDYQCDRTS